MKKWLFFLLSLLASSAAHAAPKRIAATTYSVLRQDQGQFLVVNSSSNTTLVLPLANAVGSGWNVCITQAGSGNATILAQQQDLIDNGTALVLQGGQSACLHGDGQTFWSQRGIACCTVATTTAQSSTEVDSNNDLITVLLNGSINGSLNVGRAVNFHITGSGALTGGGHVLGLLSRSYYDGTGTLPLGIGEESVYQVTNAAGTVSQMILHAVHMNNNQGNITELDGYMPILSPSDNTGTIQYTIDHGCPDWSTVPRIAVGRWCISNKDGSKVIQSAGKIYGPYGNANLNAGVVQGEVAPAAHPGWVSTNYYFGVNPSGTLTTVGALADVTYYVPIMVPQRTLLTELGVEVTVGAASSTLQLGIYRSNNGAPNGLLYSSPDQSSTGTGSKTANPNIVLETGLYWLGVQTDGGAPTLRAYNEQDAVRLIGNCSADNAVTRTLAAAPGAKTWPNVPTIICNDSSAGVFPLLWLRGGVI